MSPPPLAISLNLLAVTHNFDFSPRDKINHFVQLLQIFLVVQFLTVKYSQTNVHSSGALLIAVAVRLRDGEETEGVGARELQQ